ncbi:MAG: cupin domain-containing protein [Alphaproteobacteria bacterium]|nr:cupin domain-containing protein [Alphaproteobacteria bacterium]
MTAQEVVTKLDLQPHPEGGHYKEIYRDHPADGSRGAATAIYYLLAADEFSHWHRIDAIEMWHYYGGAPLALTISENGHDAEGVHLGLNLETGQRPFAVVPPRAWQTAVSLGQWTLVGCTVSPAFEFSEFEMAPPDWKPMPRSNCT